MTRPITEQRKKLALKYIENPTQDDDTLEELNKLMIPIYTFNCIKYLKILPHLDKDDYMLIGYVTLWKVLERCRKNPDIIENLDSYMFVSVRNAYVDEFRNYVFKNPVFFNDYEREKGAYFVAHGTWFTDYKERVDEQRRKYRKEFRQKNLELVREREREYWRKNKDKKAAKDKRYNESHKDQIREKHKQYREEHKEEIKIKKKTYAREHKEEINAYRRRYWQDNLEHCRSYHREYAKKYREEHREEINERRRQYREEHREEINARRREYRRRKKQLNIVGSN